MSKLIRQIRRISWLFPIVFIIVTTAGVILYGRGYRPDLKKTGLKSTGLLSATSDPIGAQVLVNGILKTATNNTVNLDPGWYDVKIVKEGYIPWQKKLRLQGEVVANTDPFLFPSNPSLSPLTNIGVENPVLSPDGTKIAYVIPEDQNGVTPNKIGLWVYELVERPLGFNRDPKQLGISQPDFNFSQSRILWSPDSTEILVIKDKIVKLYQTDKSGNYQDVSGSYLSILKDWEETRNLKEKQKLAAFKKEIVDMATSSAKIIAFSPDETKILYEATSSAKIPQVMVPPLIGTNSTQEQREITPGKIYVYDAHEDRNYFVLDKKELPQPSFASPSPKSSKNVISDSNYQLTNVRWFPTSRHLVLILEGKIDIMDFDRTNWVTVYSGPFSGNFMAPWPNGSRIIVLTNLNSKVSSVPNLYTVNLR